MYFGRSITADILWQMYYGRDITADILLQIYNGGCITADVLQTYDSRYNTADI